MKKNPIQTERTKQNIIDSFWIIAKEKGLQNVSISELMKKAGYNRGTFYVYFFDMNDLLNQAEENIINHLKNKLQDSLSNFDVNNFENLSTKMVDTFASYDDKLYLLLGINGDSRFIFKIRNEMSNIFNIIFSSHKNSDLKEYIIIYMSSAFVGVLTHWYESNKKINRIQLADIIYNIATHGLSGLLN